MSKHNSYTYGKKKISSQQFHVIITVISQTSPKAMFIQ